MEHQELHHPIICRSCKNRVSCGVQATLNQLRPFLRSWMLWIDWYHDNVILPYRLRLFSLSSMYPLLITWRQRTRCTHTLQFAPKRVNSSCFPEVLRILHISDVSLYLLYPSILWSLSVFFCFSYFLRVFLSLCYSICLFMGQKEISRHQYDEVS